MSRQQKQKNEQPSIVDELLENGQVTISAKTREEVNEQFWKISAEVDGVLSAGAVSQDFENGCMTLRVELIKG